MELYMVCVLIAIALGILMFKGILFVMFLMYPLPGKDLKWKRAPSLPMQELNRKFGQGSSKGGGSGSQDRPRMPPRPPPPQPPGKSSRVTSSSSREKIPSHHEERIPMESFAMEEEIKPMRVGGTRYPREIRVPFGTVV